MKVLIFFVILVSVGFYNRNKILCKPAELLKVKIIDKYFDRVSDKFMLNTTQGIFMFDNIKCYPNDFKKLYEICEIDSTYNIKVFGNKNSKLVYRTVVNVEKF